MESYQASVIVLSYNSQADLPDCLSSVLAQKGARFEVLVVDNSSPDGTAEWVEKNYKLKTAAKSGPDSPAVSSGTVSGIPFHLVRSPNNGGYSAGNNLGAQLAKGQVLVFLNPDTVAQPGWLAALLEALKNNPSAACACSKVVFADQPEKINSIGLFLSRLGFSGSLGDGEPSTKYSSDLPLFAPTGCSMAISRERFASAGRFDDSYFLYEEDLDLGWRAANRGYSSMLASQSLVWHKYHAPGSKSKFYYYSTRNRGWTIRKNMSGFERYHLLGHYKFFSLLLAAGLLLKLHPSASYSVLQGLFEGLSHPVPRDAYASPSGWSRALGFWASLSIAGAKLRKHAK